MKSLQTFSIENLTKETQLEVQSVLNKKYKQTYFLLNFYADGYNLVLVKTFEVGTDFKDIVDYLKKNFTSVLYGMLDKIIFCDIKTLFPGTDKIWGKIGLNVDLTIFDVTALDELTHEHRIQLNNVLYSMSAYYDTLTNKEFAKLLFNPERNVQFFLINDYKELFDGPNLALAGREWSSTGMQKFLNCKYETYNYDLLTD